MSEYPTIQLGDMGMGFHAGKDKFLEEFLENTDLNHRFIRGNHDDPAACKASKFWIPDGLVENNIMYVGGAWSIDRQYRTEGIDWWPDEELSIQELHKVIETYAMTRPEIMVSHDCPLSVSKSLFVDRGLALGGPQINTKTGLALQSMLEVYQPRIWIFGHWHHTVIEKIGGTTFICLNELDVCDINTETMEIIYRDDDSG